MNNVDEDKENISECEMEMAEEDYDKRVSLPFQDVVHQTENEQQPTVEIQDLDKSEESETCLNQTKLAAPQYQDNENHLDKAKSPDCEEVAVDNRECEEQDQRIGNGQDICVKSPKGSKQDAFDLSANPKNENEN